MPDHDVPAGRPRRGRPGVRLDRFEERAARAMRRTTRVMPAVAVLSVLLAVALVVVRAAGDPGLDWVWPLVVLFGMVGFFVGRNVRATWGLSASDLTAVAVSPYRRLSSSAEPLEVGIGSDGRVLPHVIVTFERKWHGLPGRLVVLVPDGHGGRTRWTGPAPNARTNVASVLLAAPFAAVATTEDRGIVMFPDGLGLWTFPLRRERGE